MRTAMVGLVLVFLSAMYAGAQSGALLYSILNRDVVSREDARVFLSASAGILPLDDNLLSLETDSGDRPATRGDVALYAMQFFDLRGDLRYELLPSTRSAFRVLQGEGFFLPWSYAGQAVTGADLIDFVHRLETTVREGGGL